ncbi:MAG: GWxTD domain-containing protein [bacterium]
MITRNCLFYAGLLVLLLSKGVHGQYEFEFLTFKFDESQTYLEIFCQVPNREWVVTITLSDTAGLPVASQTHHNRAQSADISRVEPVVVRYVFVIEPGDYTAQVTLTNPKTKAYSTFSKQVRLPNYSKEGLAFSDLQFASSITVSQDTNSLLVKNFRKVIPNAVRVYGGEVSTVFLYFEIYNLEPLADTQNNWLDVRCTILKDPVAVKSVKVRYPFGESSLAADLGIPVHDLSTGRYQLLITATSQDGQVAKKEAMFTVIKPIRLYTDHEMETLIRQMALIATPDEIGALRASKHSMAVIEHFWKSRDSTPNTEDNQAFVEFCKRLLYAGEHYKCGAKHGWETERGKMYLINGSPTQIEEVENGQEVWSYPHARYEFLLCDEAPGEY